MMKCGGTGDEQIAPEGHEIHEICNSVSIPMIIQCSLAWSIGHKRHIYITKGALAVIYNNLNLHFYLTLGQRRCG